MEDKSVIFRQGYPWRFYDEIVDFESIIWIRIGIINSQPNNPLLPTLRVLFIMTYI
jgi:hypothetical protein